MKCTYPALIKCIYSLIYLPCKQIYIPIVFPPSLYIFFPGRFYHHFTPASKPSPPVPAPVLTSLPMFFPFFSLFFLTSSSPSYDPFSLCYTQSDIISWSFRSIWLAFKTFASSQLRRLLLRMCRHISESPPRDPFNQCRRASVDGGLTCYSASRFVGTRQGNSFQRYWERERKWDKIENGYRVS